MCSAKFFITQYKNIGSFRSNQRYCKHRLERFERFFELKVVRIQNFRGLTRNSTSQHSIWLICNFAIRVNVNDKKLNATRKIGTLQNV